MSTTASRSGVEPATAGGNGQVRPREEGRSRVVISGVRPEVDGGRFAAKRTIGEDVEVYADVFTDGHDEISCDLLWRYVGLGEEPAEAEWHRVAMEFVVNDRWRATFPATELGTYQYTVTGWVDRFKTWVHDLEKRVAADQDVEVDLLIGAALVEEAIELAERDASAEAERLRGYAHHLRSDAGMRERAEAALEPELSILMRRHAPKRFATTYPRQLPVWADRPRARFSSWYEMFPRSASPDPGRHGTLQDVIDRLPYVQALGFDVLYLPPIHPIGETARKGRNNQPAAQPGDVGSPWAIGSAAGGHKAVHPDLGTVEDVERLVAACHERGMELALDIAFQCSPDHPYVREHPEWFKHRPDGTIQYAENPPKKYQDIYPFDFESEAWESLWEELESVFRFWIDRGVRIFRVDNPHTKSFTFWEWVIAEIRRDHPDVIFLAEAFTRPKVMAHLAKLGFTQSYTYFAWRNDAWGLREYFTELTQTELIDYFRPNAWPNTPDILTEFLQYGGRPAFVQRLLLAATLAANYGIYGPAFELQEHVAVRPGSEEYVSSEKYELRWWDLDAPHSLRDLVARVNRIRRDHPALHEDRNLRFHAVDNPTLLVYSKATPDRSDAILCVVNTDVSNTQSGWVHLDLDAIGAPHDHPFQVQDLVTGSRYQWNGPANYVELNPHVLPGHVLQVLPMDRSERDFPAYR